MLDRKKLDIELGTKLTFKPESCIATNPELELSTVLEEQTEDGHIVIQAPIYKGVVYTISLEETLFFHFINDMGRFDFQSVVVERFCVGELWYIKAKVTTEMTRTQLREFFRAQTTISGMITRVIEEKGKVRYQEWKCACYDISGGGAALRLHDGLFALGDEITVSLPIGPEDQTERILSTVQRSAIHDTDTYRVHLGVHFKYAGEDQRRAVMQYVMRRQRELMEHRRQWL